MEDGWSSWKTYWLHDFPSMDAICSRVNDPYHKKAILTCYGTKHVFDGRCHCEILECAVPVRLRLLDVDPKDIWRPPFTIEAEVAADVERGRVHPDYPDDSGFSVLRAGDKIKILYWPDDCIGRILIEQLPS